MASRIVRGLASGTSGPHLSPPTANTPSPPARVQSGTPRRCPPLSYRRDTAAARSLVARFSCHVFVSAGYGGGEYAGDIVITNTVYSNSEPQAGFFRLGTLYGSEHGGPTVAHRILVDGIPPDAILDENGDLKYLFHDGTGTPVWMTYEEWKSHPLWGNVNVNILPNIRITAVVSSTGSSAYPNILLSFGDLPLPVTADGCYWDIYWPKGYHTYYKIDNPFGAEVFFTFDWISPDPPPGPFITAAGSPFAGSADFQSALSGGASQFPSGGGVPSGGVVPNFAIPQFRNSGSGSAPGDGPDDGPAGSASISATPSSSMCAHAPYNIFDIDFESAGGLAELDWEFSPDGYVIPLSNYQYMLSIYWGATEPGATATASITTTNNIVIDGPTNATISVHSCTAPNVPTCTYCQLKHQPNDPCAKNPSLTMRVNSNDTNRDNTEDRNGAFNPDDPDLIKFRFIPHVPPERYCCCMRGETNAWVQLQSPASYLRLRRMDGTIIGSGAKVMGGEYIYIEATAPSFTVDYQGIYYLIYQPDGVLATSGEVRITAANAQILPDYNDDGVVQFTESKPGGGYFNPSSAWHVVRRPQPYKFALQNETPTDAALMLRIVNDNVPVVSRPDIVKRYY